ncbi:MAG: hemerythrin domain-containing protein [Janthinobacterium lividum]
MVDLPLATRPGLPDDVAYLRATFPRAGWVAHANYGELSAFWLSVHASLRDQAARTGAMLRALADEAIDPAQVRRVFAPALGQFLGHLDHHHRIEDEAYFPRFRALDARMVTGFDLLETDHDTIHAALSATAEGGRAVIAAAGAGRDALRAAAARGAEASARLAALLDRHLADEEELVIPALLAHTERAVG